MYIRLNPKNWETCSAVNVSHCGQNSKPFCEKHCFSYDCFIMSAMFMLDLFKFGIFYA